MLLQEAPAETLDFMIYGFTVILGSITLFIVSLVRRHRNLRRDLQLLEDMETKSATPASE